MPIVKNQKRKKELQIMNKTMNNKMNKTGKTKSLADYPIWVYQEFIVENNIKSEIELFAIADEQKKAGKKDLAKFVLSRSTKALGDLLENTWKMESTGAKVFRSKQIRMEVIHEYSRESCADSCSGEWLNCVLEVLQEKNIHPPYFSAAVRKLL